MLLAATSALAGEKLFKADKMFDEEIPFSFDVLYGTAEAYAAVRDADRIEVCRLDTRGLPDDTPGLKWAFDWKVLAGPVLLGGDLKKRVHELLLDRESFKSRPLCAPTPGVFMRITTGKTVVDFGFCFECRSVTITCPEWNDAVVASLTEKSFGPFLRAFQVVFPNDAELKAIKVK